MKKYINIIILILVVITFSACEKDLDLNPKDQISDPEYWKSSDDFKLAANDFYFSLMEVSQYIDRNSDIAFGGSPNEVSNGAYLVPANDNIWDKSYEFIRTANYLLLKAEESGL
ncbi:MAG: RagB/SusD family nutrient uptake outer membrane protein, partial [Prevotella sp.]|nr:RagB/SusD family nutrient uptake outer membrane protein [Prevotella sp.]